MKLHEAIEKLILEGGRPMTTTEIACILNENQWYTKKDKSQITPYQIHSRTKNYSKIFSRNGSLVLLKDSHFLENVTQLEYDNVSLRNINQNDGWLYEKNFKSASVVDGSYLICQEFIVYV